MPTLRQPSADALNFSALDEDDLVSSTESEAGVPSSDRQTRRRSSRKAPKKPVRYEFPRFEGAEDPRDFYLSRTVAGHDSDVHMLDKWFDAPRNAVGAILLLGEPGTGKTMLIDATATWREQATTTVLCTPDHTQGSLFLRFVGEGRGDCLNREHMEGDGATCNTRCKRSPFTLGPIPYAAKHGHLLYLDEVMLLQDGVKSILYSLADGRSYLPEGNVDGSSMKIHPDFRIVFSANPQVRGASLPEPLASRCAGTTLTVATDDALLKDLGVAPEIVSAWGSLQSQGLWHPQIREMRAADYWLREGFVEQAVSALVPEHCPETDRARVRNVVVSMLGGDVSVDGRLVVS